VGGSNDTKNFEKRDEIFGHQSNSRGGKEYWMQKIRTLGEGFRMEKDTEKWRSFDPGEKKTKKEEGG